MSEAIAQALPFAVAVTLSPIPVVGVVLMLGTPRARANGLAFLAGWSVGLAIAAAVLLLLSDGADASAGEDPAGWVTALRLALGVVLAALAAKSWIGRPRGGEEPEPPAWAEAIDGFSAARAAGLGLLLAAANPKSLLLTAAAMAGVAQAGVSANEQAAALAIFVAVASLGPGLPVALRLAMGERSAAVLEGIRGWMARNGAVIMAVVLGLLAAKLLADGLAAL